MDQDFGICRLSAIPVRIEPGSSKQISQLLFGEAYEVIGISSDKAWMQIKMSPDGTQGWIDSRHFVSITPGYFSEIAQSDFKITTDIVSTILYKKNPLPILLGSVVPISSSELFKMDQQFAFNGEAKSVSQKRDAEFVKSIALKYLHAPEMDGGRSPFGLCAQGLVQMVFKISGYPLPWGLPLQANYGKKVKDIFSVKSGDLAFFKDQKGVIGHTGIVLDEEKIIHVFGMVRVDHLNEEGILNPDTKVYSHSLALIRRILP